MFKFIDFQKVFTVALIFIVSSLNAQNNKGCILEVQYSYIKNNYDPFSTWDSPISGGSREVTIESVEKKITLTLKRM